jgi:hypothetical protein
VKIGLSGAHGTGKTSFFHAARQDPYFEEYTFIGSQSRKLANRLPINTQATFQSQSAIMLSMMGQELRWSEFNTFAERTPLDALAYTYYLNHRIFNGEYSQEVRIAEAAISDAMKNYDLVVYFPTYWLPEDDGVRPTDPEYQKDIAKYVMMFLTKFNIKPFVMQDEPVDKRVDHLVQWMKRKM